MKRISVRRGVVGFGLVLAILAVTTPAFAHVEAEGSTDADGTTTVTFSFTHGCAESPTTKLRVQLPANASDVVAQNPAGWTSVVSGNELSWTGGSVPNGQKAEFVADMKVAGNKGDTVFFPTIQTCAQGENAWIDKSSDPEAENAAPRIVLGQAVTSGGDHDNAAPETSAPATSAPATTTKPATTSVPPATATAKPETAAPASSPTSSSNTGLIIGIIAAIVVLGAAVTAVALRSRSRS